MRLRASVLTLSLAWIFTLQSLNMALSQQGPNPPTTPSGNVPPQPAAPTQPEPAPLPGEAIDPISRAQEELKAAQDAHEKALVEWEASTGDEGRRRTLQGARQKLTQAESMLQSARDARILRLDAGLDRLTSSLESLESTIQGKFFSLGNAGNGAGATAAAVDTGLIASRRVHLLIYATGNDGNANGIVQGAKANAVFVSELFKKMCGTSGRLATSKTRYVFGGQTIVDDLEAISPGKDDAVVVYIATHGAFESQRQTHFLEGTSGNPQFYRSEVFQRLKSRGAGLNLLVTDACGTIVGQGPPPGQLESPDLAQWPLWHLIFKTRGDVNVNAAVPGRVALYRLQRPSDSPLTQGGVFTRAFVYASVYDSVPQLNDQAWTVFFRRVSQRAQQHEALSVNGISSYQPPACFLDENGREKLKL